PRAIDGNDARFDACPFILQQPANRVKYGRRIRRPESFHGRAVFPNDGACTSPRRLHIDPYEVRNHVQSSSSERTGALQRAPAEELRCSLADRQSADLSFW